MGSRAAFKLFVCRNFGRYFDGWLPRTLHMTTNNIYAVPTTHCDLGPAYVNNPGQAIFDRRSAAFSLHGIRADSSFWTMPGGRVVHLNRCITET